MAFARLSPKSFSVNYRPVNINRHSFAQNALPQKQIRTIMSYTASKPIKRVTLIPGDGVGPEVTQSVVGIFQAADVPVDWDTFRYSDIESYNAEVEEKIIASIARNRVALKASLHTPVGGGYFSRNLKLRKDLDLFANVVHCRNLPNIKTRHSGMNVDLVVVRENTQGEYSGFEQQVETGVVQSIKIVTESASRRIAEYAFQYAKKDGRKKVTAIHKANIQKQTDGLFIKVCKEVAQKYPDIQYNEMIIDNCCMQLVMNPSQFDVMVTLNLYGNIIINAAAGLIGGPGVVGGANVGEGMVVFEPGTRHVAADIAGQNKANPVAMISSAVMMLRHLDLNDHATKIENAVDKVLAEGKVKTQDLGGNSTTKEFTDAVISAL